MRKRYIISAAGTIGASAVVGYLLRNKENREKLKEKVTSLTNKLTETSNLKQVSLVDEAGIPDQIDDPDHALMENAKMVSEGSQYGVGYYNEVKESEENHLQ